MKNKRQGMIQFESAYLMHNEKRIFDNLNLSVQKNEKVLIQGKSGTGKTTLFKVLLGFETLEKGRVTFNGQGISKKTIKEIRNAIFYLSQDIDLKNEVVRLLLNDIWETHQLDVDHHRFDNFLQLLDLNPKILDQNVKELSGGERQRLGLLIGFILDRPVWLLDEPTSALDDEMKKKLTEYILNQDKTIVIISHDDVWKYPFAIKPAVRIERWS